MLKLFQRVLNPGDAVASRPKLDPEALNLEWRFTPDPDLVRLRRRVGIVVLAVAALAAYLGRQDGFIVFVAAGFGAVAFLNLAYGLLQSGFEQSLSITASEVAFQRRSALSGHDAWREPLAAFRGVAMRERHLRERTIGNLQSTQTLHIVELEHPDAGKTVALHVQEGDPPPYAIQQAFAQRLNLPALPPGASHGTDQEDGTRHSPTSRPTPRDPGPPPAGVSVVREGQRMRIVVGQSRLKQGALRVVGWLLPLGFGALVWPLDRTMAVVAAAFGFMLLAVLSLAQRLVHPRETAPPSIVIDADSVWIEQAAIRTPGFALRIVGFLHRVAGHEGLPGTEPAERVVARASILDVRVDAYTSHAHARDSIAPGHALVRLLVESEGRRLALAMGLTDRHKLEWARDFLRQELKK